MNETLEKLTNYLNPINMASNSKNIRKNYTHKRLSAQEILESNPTALEIYFT